MKETVCRGEVVCPNDYVFGIKVRATVTTRETLLQSSHSEGEEEGEGEERKQIS